MGMCTYKEFAIKHGVPHGTVKRWAHEGMPVLLVSDDRRRRLIDESDAEAWLAARRPHSVSFYKSSTVYVVQRLSDGAIKIGYSRDLERRLRELRKETGAAVVFVAGFPGGRAEEMALQERFAHRRIDGEWFTQAGDVTAFLEAFAGVAQ